VAIAPLPSAPGIVEGVINAHGTLVPVLDIRQRFGLRRAPLTVDQHLVLAWAGRRLVALRVDRALELMAVEDCDIEPADRIAPGAEQVAGIARLADGLLVIQDLEQFLSLEEGERLDAAIPRAPASQDGGH
jgi:purine-binding chemotaxis protein CheW